MKIIFIGQAPFGGHTLETLLSQGESVTGVITVPDVTQPKTAKPGGPGSAQDMKSRSYAPGC
jgi:methionyl-tRNA formyltransferase